MLSLQPGCSQAPVAGCRQNSSSTVLSRHAMQAVTLQLRGQCRLLSPPGHASQHAVVSMPAGVRHGSSRCHPQSITLPSGYTEPLTFPSGYIKRISCPSGGPTAKPITCCHPQSLPIPSGHPKPISLSCCHPSAKPITCPGNHSRHRRVHKRGLGRFCRREWRPGGFYRGLWWDH